MIGIKKSNRPSLSESPITVVTASYSTAVSIALIITTPPHDLLKTGSFQEVVYYKYEY